MRIELERVERTARARLMDELRKDGVEVAPTIGARTMDMLASVQSRDGARPSVWVPVKVVAMGADGLSGNVEGARAPGLLIALVCDIGKPDAVRTFAFTPAKLTVVKMIALIQREGAPRAGASADPDRTRQTVFQNAIEPFAISPGQWCTKLMTMLEDNSVARA